jgi:hypothetical protein
MSPTGFRTGSGTGSRTPSGKSTETRLTATPSPELMTRLFREAGTRPELTPERVTERLMAYFGKNRYPWWYGQAGISDAKHRRAKRQYGYDRARAEKREQLAAEKVAAWAAGYRIRLERRIKAGYVIPKTALAGTGLDGLLRSREEDRSCRCVTA